MSGVQEAAPLLLNSIVANVEATLTFTLASKLVDMTLSLQQQQGGNNNNNSSSSSSNTNATWILGAICLMVLSISSTWRKNDNQDGGQDEGEDVSAAQQDLISMLNQTLVLAFSKIVLLQIRINTANASSPLVEYLRRFLEITFVVVALYAIVKILPALKRSSSSQSSGSGAAATSIASRQLGTLIINMQRTFAETVAGLITDPEIRRLIVLWGACILPTISRVIGRFRSSSYFTGKLSSSNSNDPTEDDDEEINQAEDEAIMWIAGLGMAWVNTAIGFILPNTASAMGSASVLWMQVAFTLCLAIISRAVQPLLVGINMLQGYIEWTIATASTAALASATGMTKVQLVISTGTLYCIFEAINESSASSSSSSSSSASSCSNSDSNDDESGDSAFYQESASTLMGISVLMFTNTFISWVVDSIASSAVMSSSSAFNAGLATVSMCAGVVASKVVVSILQKQQQQKQ